ncbi:hypothetical protein JCM9492_00240 [Aquifex pyrophilus]
MDYSKKILDPNGALLLVPSFDIVKEEGRVYVMFPTSAPLFFENRMEIVVWGVKCPELKNVSVEEYDREFINPMLRGLIAEFILVMHSLGIKDRESIIDNWDVFAHKTRWFEFWKRIIALKGTEKMREWWEKVKGEFERLEYAKRDELRMGNVKVGDLIYNTVEEKKVDELFRVMQGASEGRVHYGAKLLVGEHLADSYAKELLSLAEEFLKEVAGAGIELSV